MNKKKQKAIIKAYQEWDKSMDEKKNPRLIHKLKAIKYNLHIRQ